MLKLKIKIFYFFTTSLMVKYMTFNLQNSIHVNLMTRFSFTYNLTHLNFILVYCIDMNTMVNRRKYYVPKSSRMLSHVPRIIIIHYLTNNYVIVWKVHRQ